MTFREYLHRFKPTYYKTKDFTVDARVDSHFPDVASWAQVESYLRHRGACEDAIAGARLAWKRYEDAVEREA